MKRVLLFSVACLASLTARFAEAQVPIGQVQTFTTVPAVTSFSSKNIPGAGVTFATVALLDPAIQTNTAATINTALVTAAAAAPGGNAIAQWSSGGGYVLTRPTGNAYTILMATVINNTGGSLSSVVISYNLGLPSPLAGEDAELQGHRVFYSLTGADNSWTLIPGLTSPQGPNPITAGSLLATVSIGTLPANGLLYIIWVDDNGGPGTDGSFSIDNFLVSTSIACPTVTTQPRNATNQVGRTVSLSVVASGPGLTYAWNKVGFGPVDTGANPSAATPTLVINNASTSDTGDYFVTIANACGSPPVNSATAHIQVDADTFAPRFLSASVGAGLRSFRLVVDEPLCDDAGVCGAQASLQFNWLIIDGTDLVTDLGVLTVTLVNGTNVDFETVSDRDPNKTYRITVEPNFGDIRDTASNPGNQVPPGTYIETVPTLSFKQGVNGYTGVEDTELEQGTANGGPDVPHGTTTFILVDKANAGGESQALLRFNNIFGSNPGQIPLGATVVRATLVMQHTQANADGNPVQVYRMLVPWSQSTATWNNFVNGITNDGVEARVTADFTIISQPQTVPFTLNLDCTTSIQAWANGEANNGWGMINDGGDGYRFDSSSVATGPELRVEFRVNPCTTGPSISTQPPATASGTEGGSVSVAVGVSTCGATTYTWLKGALPGTPVAGANGPTLNLANLAPSDAGVYRLRATNPNGSATSDPVTISVTPDTTRPVLTHAVSTSSTTVVLTFNKPLSTTSAQTTSRYTLSGGASVSAAVLSNGANNATVTLTTSARGLVATTLTITGVTDNRASANLINPNPTVVVLTGSSIVTGADWAGSWSFNTNNLDGTPTWKNVGFVTGADWLTGNALFGTEVDPATVALFPTPIATAIGPNSNVLSPDFVTVYFRKTVTLPAIGGGAGYVLEHFIDDGAVFYWDGTEFGRYNMTNGPVVYSTKAAVATEGSRQSIGLPVSANAGGTHTLAVEVHQGGVTTSSDMLFAAQIVAISARPSLSIAHSGGSNIVSWTADSNWRLTRSASVSGPYAVVAGNPFHTFTVAPAANTNNSFFELQFNSNP